jgi:pyrroloquinoline-quinone synthase
MLPHYKMAPSAQKEQAMQVISKLNHIISSLHLLKHTFYQAWSEGKLTQDHLQHYAAQYYHQVQSFPCFISRVHTHCPHIEARKVLLQNLTDEEIHGTDHPALWMQFANGMGASEETVLNAQPLAQTQKMVETFYALAQRDWRDGLCALYAYESQVPAVSSSKIDGLKKFYGVTDEKTLEFFSAHQAYDVEHAQQVANLIEKYVEPAQAERATEEAALALWGFLDGICHANGIEC